jgi:hypothetical protein
MGKHISYSKIENEIRPHFRNNLNLAESSEDVKKFFVYAVQELLDKAFKGKITADYGEIELRGGDKQPFVIHKRLLHDLTFMNAWCNSDLPLIIERLASTAVKHMKHFGKMPDKTESKMFPTASHGGRSFKNPPGP